MLLRTNLVASSIAALALAAAATLLVAGPLNPPGGAVSSTYKTLTEVEPRIAVSATNTPGNATAEYIISAPGSYYLTGSFVPGNGKNAIRINASNVNLDLNGFQITAGVNPLAGITTDSNAFSNITITNGQITNFTGGAVMFVNGVNCNVSNIRVSAGGAGILVSRGGIIADCTVYAPAGVAYAGYENVHFTRCVASSGSTHGFVVNNSFCTFEHCTASGNGGDGFRTNNSLVSDCIADNNTGNGFLSGYADNITRCSASYNTLNGISVTNLATIDRCTVVQNKQIGINAANTSTVRGCVVASNITYGIRANSRCTIVDNHVSYNGPGNNFPGIGCDADYNTVEGNMCTGNTFGVYISASKNLIIRNICSGNTNLNYFIVSGNRVGTINTGSPTVGQTAGNSGGGLGFTDPNSNFAY